MRKNIFILLSLYLLPFNLLATNYYISNSGNDDNNGQNQENAWKTIAKVNSINFNPGDSILFEKGGIWREELVIQNSGSSNNFIVYASYGSGDKPRILGSGRAETWTEVQTHIWKSTSVLSAPRQRTGNTTTNHPSSIFFGEMDGSITWGNMENIHLNSEGAPKDICECTRDNGFDLMDKEYDWCWEADHIYVYSDINPADKYDYLEVPQRSSAIKMESHKPQEYIKIENLELMFALKYGFDGGWPMAYAVKGLEVKNCHIGFMGTKGAASAIGLQVWHSDMLIQNNEIHDCGRRNISYNVYSDTRTDNLIFENVTFDKNILHNGYHTTGIDINGGYTDEFRNFVIKNNYIWDNPEDDPNNSPNDFSSMGLFLNAGSASFTGFKVYNNVFSFIKQKHIAASNLKNSFIRYNTFYGMNTRAVGSGYRQMILVSKSPENLVIDNNIFHGNINDEYVLSCITFSDNSHLGATLDYNLYYQDYPTQRIVTVNASNKSYKMSDWDTYKTDTDWDAGSPTPSDPLFSNAPDDLSLGSNSPAINTAIYYPEISTDILSKGRNQTPCIGAYEYNGISTLRYSVSQNKMLLVYPNPTYGEIKITSNAQSVIERITIIDISGKTIIQTTKLSEDGELDISNFESGIYFVGIQMELETRTVKIVKK